MPLSHRLLNATPLTMKLSKNTGAADVENATVHTKPANKVDTMKGH